MTKKNRSKKHSPSTSSDTTTTSANVALKLFLIVDIFLAVPALVILYFTCVFAAPIRSLPVFMWVLHVPGMIYAARSKKNYDTLKNPKKHTSEAKLNKLKKQSFFSQYWPCMLAWATDIMSLVESVNYAITLYGTFPTLVVYALSWYDVVLGSVLAINSSAYLVCLYLLRSSVKNMISNGGFEKFEP